MATYSSRPTKSNSLPDLFIFSLKCEWPTNNIWRSKVDILYTSSGFVFGCFNSSGHSRFELPPQKNIIIININTITIIINHIIRSHFDSSDTLRLKYQRLEFAITPSIQTRLWPLNLHSNSCGTLMFAVDCIRGSPHLHYNSSGDATVLFCFIWKLHQGTSHLH